MIRLSCLNECTSASSAFVKNEDMLLTRTKLESLVGLQRSLQVFLLDLFSKGTL